MRVLHILPSLDEAHGGPLRLVLDLSAQATDRGLESEVIGLGPLRVHDNPLAPGMIHALSGAGWKGWAYRPSIRLWLRRHLNRFDGVIIHGAWLYPGWAAASECMRAGVPYAYYPHGMIEKWAVQGQGKGKELKKRLYWELFEKGIATGARCVLFTTQREMDLTGETFSLNSPKRLLVPYGIGELGISVTQPKTQALRQPPEIRVALYLGRLHPKKNPDLLIEAWRKSGPPTGWRLVLAGSGSADYEEQLRAQVRSSKLETTVQFAGFVAGQDKLYILQRADWFLLPSSQENFGIAVLEAVQNGCAVALSDSVYLTESFPAESEILAVEESVWTAFLRDRMIDDDWRRRVRDGNQDHLLRVFGMDTVITRWVQTFEELFLPRHKRSA